MGATLLGLGIPISHDRPLVEQWDMFLHFDGMGTTPLHPCKPVKSGKKNLCEKFSGCF